MRRRLCIACLSLLVGAVIVACTASSTVRQPTARDEVLLHLSYHAPPTGFLRAGTSTDVLTATQAGIVRCVNPATGQSAVEEVTPAAVQAAVHRIVVEGVGADAMYSHALYDTPLLRLELRTEAGIVIRELAVEGQPPHLRLPTATGPLHARALWGTWTATLDTVNALARGALPPFSLERPQVAPSP